MSRGAGRVMRQVQQRLTTTPTPVMILARAVYGVPEPTRAQVESVRRAVKRLEELGQASSRRDSVYWPPGVRWPDGEELPGDVVRARPPLGRGDRGEADARRESAGRQAEAARQAIRAW